MATSAGRWRPVLVVALLVALVAGLLGAFSWWRHPTAFESVGQGGSFVMSPRALDRFPVLVSTGSLARGRETVTLRDVRYRWRQADTGNALDLFVCTPADPGGWIGPASLADGVAGLCTDLRPARTGETMRLDPDGGDQLVYRVTPRRQGRSQLDWIEVDYARGARYLWQRGTQRIEERATIRVG